MTTLPDLQIRQAALHDEASVSAILREAVAWLQERGTPMWRDSEMLPERIRADVAGGLFWIATIGGEDAGTMKLQLSDPLFWPDIPEDAVYLHRFAVRRRFAGGALSFAMLAWAAQRAESLSRPFLRLDCEATRPRLRAVYERFGFRHHSDRQVGPYYVARYEYRLGERSSLPG